MVFSKVFLAVGFALVASAVADPDWSQADVSFFIRVVIPPHRHVFRTTSTCVRSFGCLHLSTIFRKEEMKSTVAKLSLRSSLN